MHEAKSSKSQYPQAPRINNGGVGEEYMRCTHSEKVGVCGAVLNIFGVHMGEVQCMYGHRFHLGTLCKSSVKE